MKIELTSRAEAETLAIADRLATLLRGGDFIALEGELGAGKTRFVRGLAHGLGLNPDRVSSPTFVICHEYESPAGFRLVHVDAYRLRGTDELETIGWDEIVADTKTIVAMEWPERVPAALPAARVTVRLAHAGHDARRITITATGALAERLEPFRG